MIELRHGLVLEILPNEQIGLFGGDVDGLDSLTQYSASPQSRARPGGAS
jgi:hypothetical protein